MDANAIQTEVVEESHGEAKPVAVEEKAIVEAVEDENISDRERIALKYKKQQEEELGISQEEPDAELDEELEVVSPDEPELVEVKINGQLRQVPKEKIETAGGVEVYQKQVSANESLKQVSDERNALRDERQQFEQWQVEQKQKLSQSAAPSATDEQKRSDPPLGDQNKAKDLAKQYREAMYEGEESKADEIMTRMMSLNKAQDISSATTESKEIDVEAIRNEAADLATQRIEQKQRNTDLKSAQQAFDDNFADIKGDPELFKMADRKTLEIQRDNPDWTPQQIIEESGKQVRAWVEKFGGKPQPNSAAEKLAAKRSMQSVKAGTGKAKAPAPVKQQTRSSYVAQLRENRGQ